MTLDLFFPGNVDFFFSTHLCYLFFTLYLHTCSPLRASVAIKFKVHKSVVLTTIPPPLPSATIVIRNTQTLKSLQV